MPNISARAPGLVGLLELITDGRVPDNLAGVVQPTIELTDFYCLAKRELLTITETSRASLGELFLGSSSNTVPNGEAWIVLSWTVQVQSAASRTAVQSGYYRGNPFPGFRGLGPTGDNGGAGVALASIDRPFLLGPTSVLSGFFSQNAGSVSLNFSGQGEIVRFRI